MDCAAAWLVTVLLHIAPGGANEPGFMEPLATAQQLGQASTEAERASANWWRERIEIGGQISLLGDVLPKRDVAELRARAEVEAAARLSDRVRARFEGFVEGLLADRGGRVSDGAVRVRDAWIEAAASRADVRAGYGRIVWGRLDEIQPSDVINPIDTARFLFDGRSAARLPVAFLSGRVFLSETATLQAVVSPRFRRGSFDELDEATSPFNLYRDVVLPEGTGLAGTGFAAAGPVEGTDLGTALAPIEISRERPRGIDGVSGGARLSATAGRVDFAVAAYRGRDGFGTLTFEPQAVIPGQPPDAFVVGRLVERYPRFTMIAADFETVRGEWAWRGEAAVFVEKTIVSESGLPGPGRVVDAGIGFDRRTGNYRVFGSVLIRREWSHAAPSMSRTDVSIVGSIEREFARERYLARVFAVVNPGDASAFVRALVVARLRDNLALELSGAGFAGTGDDTLSRFRTRDFGLARVRVYW